MVRKKSYTLPHDGPPDNFDPENPYKDPVAAFEMREYLVREKWIGIEKAKILRERVKMCYRIEGVNHLQKCRHLVQRYLDATRGVGWGKDTRPLLFTDLRWRNLLGDLPPFTESMPIFIVITKFVQ